MSVLRRKEQEIVYFYSRDIIISICGRLAIAWWHSTNRDRRSDNGRSSTLLGHLAVGLAAGGSANWASRSGGDGRLLLLPAIPLGSACPMTNPVGVSPSSGIVARSCLWAEDSHRRDPVHDVASVRIATTTFFLEVKDPLGILCMALMVGLELLLRGGQFISENIVFRVIVLLGRSGELGCGGLGLGRGGRLGRGGGRLDGRGTRGICRQGSSQVILLLLLDLGLGGSLLRGQFLFCVAYFYIMVCGTNCRPTSIT